MGVTWTKEQQKVIELRDRNILVSAAAGSGKTAVLVERIIHRLTKENPPVDIDRMLIVTYTDAAAAEMKDRISAAITKAVEENPSDEHLRRQQTLIHTAKITTIHSFCMSVIREYFHVIDLDPGFRVGEDGELRLLRQDVLSEILEAHFESGDEEFLQFVETFATGREDTKLEEIIEQLYHFSGSYPDPDVWLDHAVEAYESGMEEDSEFIGKAVSYIRNCLNDIRNYMEKARELCGMPDGPYMYETTIDADEQLLEQLFDVEAYQEMYRAFPKKGSWARLAANRDKSVDPCLTSRVKELRETWKKSIDNLRDTFFFQEPKEMQSDLDICVPVLRVLVDLVKEFASAFALKKAEKNLIDFRDMEQFALRILTRKEGETLVPSETAREYQEQFLEVMIDEYQDSNYLQEAILTSVSRISRGENNLFMVGDVKQSIYRFRLSRPELFMQKFESYSTEDSENCRIDLHKNFRSRSEVLNSVNAIFCRIMTKSLGKIEYDDNAALYVGADYPEHPDNETELLIIDTEMEEEEEPEGADQKPAAWTNREIEARAVAERIHLLMETQKVWDKEEGTFRKVRYRDIVILSRSLAGWTEVFSRILNQEGIPAYAESKEGYFHTLEIGWMLDYLKILDNFRQDLPLAAVLKSPFGGMNSEELAEIRTSFPDIPFFEAVRRAEEMEGETARKIHVVLEKIRSFKERVPYTSIHDLLWQIMTETGYRDYISAMPGGEQRAANLEMLLVRAKSFEATSYKGLFHFIRYVQQLQKYEVDYGEAGIYDDQTDAVRLMSIHKSKGLEFPVVIVVGMGKRFNTQDLKGSIVIHPELGIGIDAVDIEKRTKSPSILKKVIQMESGMENLGEELRVLYVAMTRAREKLIMTGIMAGAEKKMEMYQNSSGQQNEALEFTSLVGAKQYFDWIIPAAVDLPESVPLRMQIMGVGDIVGLETEREVEDKLDKNLMLMELAKEESLYARTDAVFAERLAEQFGYQYPFEGEEQLKLKFTVSELKKKAAMADAEENGEMLIEEEEVVPLIPEFLKEKEELTGALRGSTYHKLLELFDFTKEYDEEMLHKEIQGFRQEGFLTEEMADCINSQDILDFLKTDIGVRMKKAASAGKLHREQPFVFGVDAKELYPDTVSDELVLIQGIIDVYFEEENELVVLDYKTDRVKVGKELIDRYKEQLHLYGRALEQMTLKKVKEEAIYSFTLKEEIKLDLPKGEEEL
ncbi:MAG: helicase-exonuclease AddAB subunit AddA [Bariatricus sp.]|nr:helicase-exonuclease AddAB subunit AddA [Bariatricus sp.]